MIIKPDTNKLHHYFLTLPGCLASPMLMTFYAAPAVNIMYRFQSRMQHVRVMPGNQAHVV